MIDGIETIADIECSGCSIYDVEFSGCSIDGIEFSGCSVDCGGCSIIVAWRQLPDLVGRLLYLCYVVIFTGR